MVATYEKSTESAARSDSRDRVATNQPVEAPVTLEERDAMVPRLFHLLPAAWIVLMLLVGRFASDRYYMLMQEDRLIEWMTVGLFFAAGTIGMYHAVKQRRIFDGLVALFCLFVAGEEFSWGQRLLGFSSPEYFLGSNVQQELTVHNMVQGKGHRTFMAIALAGYGVVLPLLADYARPRRLMQVIGATPPPAKLAAWFIVPIALGVWYPMRFTGEWSELLAGGLFLAASACLISPRLTWKKILLALPVLIMFGGVMTTLSDVLDRGRDPERIACATAEAQALLSDIVDGEAATEKLSRKQKTDHRRIWTAIRRGYLHGDHTVKFNEAKCHDVAAQEAAVRRQYAVDPWGTSYWLIAERLAPDAQAITIYSFGPNRRRDGKISDSDASPTSDDIIVTGILRKPAN